MVGRIHLFGRFEAVTDDGPVLGLEARKVQELFAYLLLSRDRPVQRERLADLLWPNADAARSKKYLRQALWQLQKVADTWVAGNDESLLTVDQEWIRISPCADLWADIYGFEHAYESVITAPAERTQAEPRELLRQAVATYRGELLEGWYQDWCLRAQDTYRSMYVAMLDWLMQDAESRGNWEAGLAYGRKTLLVDRACERTHLRMMRLYCMAGNRTAALRQYQWCVTALDEELAVEPEEAITSLYERIRQEGHEAVAAESGNQAAQTSRHQQPDQAEGASLVYLHELNRSIEQLHEKVTERIRVLGG